MNGGNLLSQDGNLLFDVLDDNSFVFSQMWTNWGDWESWMSDRSNDMETASSSSSEFSASLLDIVTSFIASVGFISGEKGTFVSAGSQFLSAGLDISCEVCASVFNNILNFFWWSDDNVWSREFNVVDGLSNSDDLSLDNSNKLYQSWSSWFWNLWNSGSDNSDLMSQFFNSLNKFMNDGVFGWG